MCGICGVIQVGGEPRAVLAHGVLDRMTDVMRHRGPNDRGTHEAPGVALGARRLSIVDVEGGRQPVRSEDETVWAAQNGELYNHLELRRQLDGDGHRFASRCDTEILPHLYERDGERYPERLRGKFATAVWDGQRRRAVLARDRLGVKPLYWARRGDLVLFGSELKSLLASGVIEPELDYEAIDAYLTFGFLPGPRTPLAGVHKLLPGHRLVVDEAGARSEAYWRYPEPQVAEPRLAEQEYAQRLLELLEESVRLRLMSDVPLGAMLSGGLDSSLIVALMARNMAEPVKTFSVGFKEAGAGNELANARLVAEAFGTDHHEVELSLTDDLVGLAELVWFLDEPLSDLSAVGFYALSRLAAKEVTVALSGQGADELLGGYPRHRSAAIVAAWGRLPTGVQSLLAAGAARGPARWQRASAVLAAPDAATRYLVQQTRLPDELRERLFVGPLEGAHGEYARSSVEQRVGTHRADAVATSLALDGQLGLVEDMLHYFDRTSMAHSLEVRVPFLDHHLVEHCATIPSSLKVRRGQQKYLLRRLARGIVPDEVLARRKVGFFSSAVDGWVEANLRRHFADYLLDPAARYAEFLDREVVKSLLSDSLDGRSSALDRRLLLAVLVLEVWLSEFLARALPHEPSYAVIGS
jgi:asparagine synthase (glutamine-hydrolysing)